MLNPYLWTINITFSDGIKMNEQVASYCQVASRFQTWREDTRDEQDRPVIKVFPPYSLAGVKQ